MVSFAFRSSNSSTGQEVTTHTHTHTQEVHTTEDREQTNKTKMGMKNKTTTRKIVRVIKQNNEKGGMQIMGLRTHAAEDHGKAGWMTSVCNALRHVVLNGRISCPHFPLINSTDLKKKKLLHL